METFNQPKKCVNNKRFAQERKEALAALDLSCVDSPIADIIDGFTKLSHCFTLQCCYGHFVYSPDLDIHNLNSILNGYDDIVKYKIAYIAFCIEDSRRGRAFRNSLARIVKISPNYVQFGSPDWFWEHQVNSFVLQVEPYDQKHKDQAVLTPAEALQTREIRKLFFKKLRELLAIELIKQAAGRLMLCKEGIV